MERQEDKLRDAQLPRDTRTLQVLTIVMARFVFACERCGHGS
jgi:hypothetical protein